MKKLTVLLPYLVLAAGCRSSSSQLAKLSDEFVYTTLAFSPATATSVGLHEHGGKKLDELLDDFSASSLDRQRRFYEKVRERLEAIRPDRLTAQERADRTILEDQARLALLDLNEIQSPSHSPTLYVETLGNALFTPFVLEYAPKAERIRHIIARLKGVPLFLDQASSNLVSAPSSWTEVAIAENEGNIALVDKTIRAAVPAELQDAYNRAARTALDAMQMFQKFLRDGLPARGDYGWRLGSSRYSRKFQYVLETGMAPDTTLATAEHDLAAVRARMLELALPIHRSIAAAHRDHDAEAGRENAIIREVLDHIAQKHSTPESYMDDARRDLEEARGFAAANRLLTLPRQTNLKVIETPEFMRGIYAVGGFNPAPALEPRLGAFYWVTPIPAAWPAERKNSKLREYNFYKLKLLTIHEAMPGHYVQAEFANGVEPQGRRVLRAVFGNGPYVEGWAQFATEAMLDAGFGDRSPEMRLTFLKEELRVLANAILDIRLHMLDMKEEEALDLMRNQAFQEQEEAAAKLQRARLSACQLPTYYVGWRGWTAAREAYRKAKGGAFQPQEFNDWALRQGAVPLPALGELLR